MIIKLYGDTQFIVTRERLEEIKQAIEQGATFIWLNDHEGFAPPAISSITEGGYDQLDYARIKAKEDAQRIKSSKRKELE